VGLEFMVRAGLCEVVGVEEEVAVGKGRLRVMRVGGNDYDDRALGIGG
jgi:hypothetical protein